MAISDSPIATRSNTERCLTAEMMPTDRPKISHTTTPPIVSEIVAGRFCRIWSSTSVLLT